MKADILSREDQVDTKEDNQDVKMLKNKLQIRRVTIEAEVVIIRGNQVVKETTLLKEIRRNQTSVVATTSQKTNSNTSNKSQGRYQVRITRGLNKKSLIHSYTCCGNHLLQRQMITQAVNLLVEYQVGNSQENSTRSLC